jgi:hypothetical protein
MKPKTFVLKTLAVASSVLLVVAASGGVAAAQTAPSTVPSSGTSTQDNALARTALIAEANAVADFLQISPEQLQSELVGHSLAQVGQQHGKTPAEMTTVVVDTAHAQIDAAVNDGDLTPEEAAEYKLDVVNYAPMVVRSVEASAYAIGAVAGD